MAAYKIGKLSVSKYFEHHRARITAIANWQHKTDAIAYSVHSIAPHIPFSVIRKSFVRIKKKWQVIDEVAFAKNFGQE
jgi:hypothetical protein